MKTAIILLTSSTRKTGQVLGEAGPLSLIGEAFKVIRKGGSPIEGFNRMFVIDLETGERVRAHKFKLTAPALEAPAEPEAPVFRVSPPVLEASPAALEGSFIEVPSVDGEAAGAESSAKKPVKSRRPGINRNPGDAQK